MSDITDLFFSVVAHLWEYIIGFFCKGGTGRYLQWKITFPNMLAPDRHTALYNLALYTRGHLYLEFTGFRHSTESVDIRGDCPISISTKINFSAEVRHPQDRVSSEFADDYIPLLPMSHDRAATSVLCFLTVYWSVLCSFSVICSFYPQLKTTFSVDVLLIGTALIFLFEKGIRAYRDWDTRL